MCLNEVCLKIVKQELINIIRYDIYKLRASEFRYMS